MNRAEQTIAPFRKLAATIVDHPTLGTCVRITGWRLVDLPDGPHLLSTGSECVTVSLAKHGGDIDKATNAAFDRFVELFIDGAGALAPSEAAS